MRALFLLILLLGLAGVAEAQPSGCPFNSSSCLSTATGSTTARALANRAAERINVKDYGAKGDAVGWINGTIAAGSRALTSTSATFTAADVGKAITLGGSGTSGVTQSGTITAFTDSHHVTVSFTSVLATPYVGALLGIVSTQQSGSGSYAPGDTVTDAGGTGVIPAVFTIIDTSLVSATVNAAGSGGTTGACILTGTTGTQKSNGAANLFTINATIAAGAISSLGAIISAGDYTANPTSLAAEPVTSNCSLTGATLTIKMGPSTAHFLYHITAGNYTALPSSPVATTTSGSGTGLTITPSSQAVLGGQVTYGTDDSAALAAAVNKSNAAYTAGNRAVIYAPAGNYIVKGTQIPTFVGGGSIIGDEAYKTTFYLDPSYSGDLFSWSEAWEGVSGSFPTPGNTASLSLIAYGPTVRNITVMGDKTAAAQQNAFMFYDRNDQIMMEDVQALYLNGRALCLGCALKNTTSAYSRESRFSRLRFFQDGAAGIPTMEIGSIGVGGGDDLRFSQVDIYASHGPGLAIRAQNGTGLSQIHFTQLRIEGEEYVWPQAFGDHIQIGDAGGSYATGQVTNTYFNQVQLTTPYSGSAAVHLTASNATYMPYAIQFNESNIAGGDPLGSGVNIEAGRSLYFNFGAISTLGSNFTVAAAGLVSSPIGINMNGLETAATYSVDSTSVNFVRTGVAKLGQPGGSVGTGSIDMQASRTAAAQTASAPDSIILSGINNSVTGIGGFSVITNGSANTIQGTNSRLGGVRGFDHGRYAADCYSSGNFLIATGESQTCTTVLRASTTSTTQTQLTSNMTLPATAFTCLGILDKYAFGVSIHLVANNRTTNGNTLDWVLTQGMLTRGTGVASTSWTGGTPTTLSTGSVGTIAVGADTTLGCLSLKWTAPNSDTWDVNARVVTTENF